MPADERGGAADTHIDCAYAYANEEEVGAAIKESEIPREKIFVTS